MKISCTLLPVLILILFSAGCKRGSSGVPEGIIPRDKMISILAEIHITDAMLHEETNSPKDKNNLALVWYPSVLDKFGVSRAEVDSSLFYYNERPRDFSKMYDEVMTIINQRLDEVKKSQLANEQDE